MRLRYGKGAPRFAERIWVDPRALDRRINLSGAGSGVVLGGGWDQAAKPLREDDRVTIACRKHWLEGYTWDEAGVFDHFAKALEKRGQRDGCRTMADVRARYERLDRLFEQVKAEGLLRPQGEIAPWSFREYDGILVHVDRHGRPIFGRRGCHRLAVARLLEIERIPAQVGVVHEKALPDWRAAFQ
ncbi:hypothetical protein [Thioalkalivibrio sp. ALJ3]|uniref:hypothetical protein n=1 Tax=Thioalkalivibrio sp. ALJ3 TaxID=1240557 RepID=UPI000370F9D2|nr:hypothetical protein [Thioalkalivibrio sp. ALJ3]